MYKVNGAFDKQRQDLLEKFLFHLLITERLKLNELAATFSQDIGLIFEAINDAVYFVLDKTAIR